MDQYQSNYMYAAPAHHHHRNPYMVAAHHYVGGGQSQFIEHHMQQNLLNVNAVDYGAMTDIDRCKSKSTVKPLLLLASQITQHMLFNCCTLRGDKIILVDVVFVRSRRCDANKIYFIPYTATTNPTQHHLCTLELVEMIEA